jgi:integrin beta 3
MADSPSGVIQRPGETTGRPGARGTGRVPRAGQPGQARTGAIPGQPGQEQAPGRPGAPTGPAVPGLARPPAPGEPRPGHGRPEQGRPDQGRPEWDRPEQGRPEQGRTERDRPEQGRTERDRQGQGHQGRVRSAGGPGQAVPGAAAAAAAGIAAAGVARPGVPPGSLRPGMPADRPAAGVARPGMPSDQGVTGLARPGPGLDESPSGPIRPAADDEPPYGSAHSERSGRVRPGVGEHSAAGLARPGVDGAPSGPIRPGVGDQPAFGSARPGMPPDQPTGLMLPGSGADRPSGPVRAGIATPPGQVRPGPGHLSPDDDLDAGPGRGTGPVAPVRGTGRVAVATASAGVAVPSHLDDQPDADDAEAGGLRSELRQQLRTKRRLRVVTLVTLSVIVLVLLPLLFGIRATTRDPVFTSLDSLDVPGWAAQKVSDQSSGSRWCFIDCRFRERTAQSQQPFAATDKAYAGALKTAGWLPWKVAGCPDQPIAPSDGIYSCWRRDEFTLDLWVRLPECAVDQVAAKDPAVLPSAGANGVVPTTPPGKCTGSTVSIKVQNAITDKRGTPDGEKPGLTGETPDPVLSNDPLLEPTPSPS